MRAETITLPTAAALALILLIADTIMTHTPIYYNATASAPLGFYLRAPGLLSRGDWTVVSPDTTSHPHIPHTLLKRVAALAPDHIRVTTGAVYINGARLAERHPNHPFPELRIDRRLRSHEVFVLNPRTRSIDSRYLGPIHRTNVERVEPLWTWKDT